MKTNIIKFNLITAAMFIVCSLVSQFATGQITLATNNGNMTNNSGYGTVTFNFQNNNSFPVRITGVEGIVGESGFNTCEVWYKTTPINGNPGWYIWNYGYWYYGWNLGLMGSFQGVANTTTTVTQPFLTPGNTFGGTLVIPAGATYGISMQVNDQRYHSYPHYWDTEVYLGGGCRIYTGYKVGYGQANEVHWYTANWNQSCGWIGKLTFEPANTPCSSPPVAGTVVSSVQESVTPNQMFTLSLAGASFGVGQTLQWQSSTDNITFTNISGATNHTFPTSQAATTWYKCQVSCGVSTVTTNPLKITTIEGQVIASGSMSNSSFFMCSNPGKAQGTGDNAYGQIGDNTTVDKNSPVPIGGTSDIIAVSSGPTHTLYLRSDGTVYASGQNIYGQLGDYTQVNSEIPVQVRTYYGGILTNVKAIAAGANFSLFLKNNGTVWACGYNGDGQLGNGTNVNNIAAFQVLKESVNTSYLHNVTAIAAGTDHSLFLVNDVITNRSYVYACGSNFNGQLGLSDTTIASRDKATLLNFASTNIKGIAAGYRFSLFLAGDTAWSCGNNAFGQLGLASSIDMRLPQIVHGPGNTGVLKNIKLVAAGSAHSLFLKNDSTAWACGRNAYGQLGDNTLNNKDVPVKVNGLTNCIKIAGGAYHSLFLKSDATFWGCGRNNTGQLGDGSNTNRNAIVQLNTLTLRPTITGGPVFNGSGTLFAGDYSHYSWSTGSLVPSTTINSTGTYSVLVTDANGCTGTASQKVNVNAQSIASGSHSFSSYFMCSAPGKPKACGMNQYGQLGDGTTIDKNSIVPVNGLTDVRSISGSYSHTLFLKSDNTVWASGHNIHGQLGDFTNVDKITPVQVSGLTEATDVSAGRNHSLFLKSNGTVRACGDNTNGQLGDSTTISRNFTMIVPGLSGITAIAAGSNHSLFLKNDGTVWACGSNYNGQLGDGTYWNSKLTPAKVNGLTGIIAIAAGEKHSLFLKSDGTVWGCGDNGNGQLGQGFYWGYQTTPIQVISLDGPYVTGFLTDIMAIAAGGEHSLCLKNDGTVISFGAIWAGQLGTGQSDPYGNAIPEQVHGIGNTGVLTNIVAIEAGYDHSLFLKDDGSVAACGNNVTGQLGIGNNNNKNFPVLVDLQPSILTISATANPICKGKTTTISIASGDLRGASVWKWYTGSCGGTLVGTGNSISVAPNNNTKYYLRGEGGCQAPGSCENIQIIVNALPVLTVTPSVDTICPPTTNKLLTVVGASTYSWTPPNGLNQITGPAVLAAPTTTTTYTVVGTDVNGCSSTKTATIVVKPVPNNLSATNITATSAVINWSYISCAVGYMIQYKVSTSSTWTTVNINSNISSITAGGLIPNTTYHWKVKTKFSNGTYSGFPATQTFKTLALRLGETAVDDNFNLFPNPSTGLVTISMHDCDDCSAQVSVFDVLGNVVFVSQFTTDGHNKTIDLSQLAKGAYHLRIEYDGLTKNSKLVIQ